ncbi:CBS domain-containing protein [Neomoorella thermoacetica]|uniref:Hypoxic response protein 1 n=3 Tax=Neomoorella thermoacetica TaxID=1525 RepID=A0A1D7XD02_NEOTH|nr:CBS domain-containing protein [Moorella thermoacetica]AKX94665.1 hypoxic response protein 1 [Moorella thermoacetica]AKX97298.1 hypoxic response protein 1 [Moorella thermoacetica]AOQ24814.1 Hypoxic response protein 1 [Moorella thermoacetica]APC09076.1 hypoxic response protein 1 [Moorella thermoacetica]OIQ09427.1 hypoxic response protein 1 [Moorella thermoacetica]
MLARDIMTTNVITITPSARIYELTRLLAEKQISGVPVCDGDNHVVGIVGEADLLGLVNGHLVRDIMSQPVIGVDAEDPVEKVAAILHEKRIKRVPVYSNGRLVGIISRADIVAAMARENK